jgi:putative transposase
MNIEYNNLYTHFILITQNRYPFITEEHRIRIEKYITGIVKNHESKLYTIYANPEHVHFLVSRSPKISEQSLLSRVAKSTSIFIRENQLCNGNFAWQESASAFSVSKSEVDKICKYILNQPLHHKKTTFEKEYQQFLVFYQRTLSWELGE